MVLRGYFSNNWIDWEIWSQGIIKKTSIWILNWKNTKDSFLLEY